VALLHPRKGIATLLEAMGVVARSHPDAVLAIGGDGPQRAELEQLAAELGIAGSVRWVGPTDGAAPVIRGADLFVLPSLAESFPYSVLEAMSLGVPIVATDVGGVGEAIEDGTTGVLVPPRDPDALGRGMSSLLGDGDRAGALGAAARNRFEQRFTLSAMVEATADVYREVVG
jgi:glycosyltransferase involved in cell wall biosynthesis